MGKPCHFTQFRPLALPLVWPPAEPGGASLAGLIMTRDESKQDDAVLARYLLKLLYGLLLGYFP